MPSYCKALASALFSSQHQFLAAFKPFLAFLGRCNGVCQLPVCHLLYHLVLLLSFCFKSCICLGHDRRFVCFKPFFAFLGACSGVCQLPVCNLVHHLAHMLPLNAHYAHDLHIKYLAAACVILLAISSEQSKQSAMVLFPALMCLTCLPFHLREMAVTKRIQPMSASSYKRVCSGNTMGGRCTAFPVSSGLVFQQFSRPKASRALRRVRQISTLASVVDALEGSDNGGQASECSADATALSTPSGAASGSVSRGASNSPAWHISACLSLRSKYMLSCDRVTLRSQAVARRCSICSICHSA